MTRPLPDETDERLCAWVDGAMTPRELERFESELRVSKSLRERAEAYRRNVIAVREGLAHDAHPIDVADAVLAQIRGGGGAQGTPQRDPVGPRLPSVPGAWWRSALVAAAMLAVIFVLDRMEPRAKTSDLTRAERVVPAVVAGGGAARDAKAVDGADMDLVAQQVQGSFVDAPRTMVPQLTLRLAAQPPAPAEAGPQEPRSKGVESAPRTQAGLDDKAKDKAMEKRESIVGDSGGGAGGFGGVDVLFGDLADSVRAIGPVRLQALAPASEGNPQRAWVATGGEAEVRSFLANVSLAAKAMGYFVENGEARAADVDQRTPRAKSDARAGAAGRIQGTELRVVIVLDRPAK